MKRKTSYNLKPQEIVSHKALWQKVPGITVLAEMLNKIHLIYTSVTRIWIAFKIIVTEDR